MVNPQICGLTTQLTVSSRGQLWKIFDKPVGFADYRVILTHETAYKPTVGQKERRMEFHLRRKSEVSKALLAGHPLWAEYYEPGEVDVICEWGVPRDLVTSMLENVDWSDEFMFPILRVSDAPRFQFFYASAEFLTPEGKSLVGYAFNDGPTSISIFHDDDRLILNQCAPEMTEEDEALLRKIFQTSLYPLEVSRCAFELRHRVLDPYEKQPNKAPEPTPGLVTIHAAHGSRQVPSWLIFDVRQRKMPSERPSDFELQAMTVNERLFACGLMAEFDSAILRKERTEAMVVLSKVAMSEKEASYTVDTILQNPRFYGY